jgi:hypothetical protein
MKTNPDPERDDALLEAVLRDENWQSADAAFKAEAVGTFRARQRLSRLTRWTGGLTVSAAILAGAAYWMNRPTSGLSPQTLAQRSAAPKAPDTSRFLTDQQLLASFPEGSCFIAEVEGRKELVFLDPKVERIYLARTGSSE